MITQNFPCNIFILLQYTFIFPPIFLTFRRVRLNGCPVKKNLLQQIAQGDEKAFELLFREHYQGLCYFAMQYLNEYQAAENTVQETFVKIWEKRNELHIKSSVKQYLLNMVKNRCLNYLAHQKVKNEYSQKATDDLSRERIDPSKYFLEVDLAKRIQESIDSLPPGVVKFLFFANRRD